MHFLSEKQRQVTRRVARTATKEEVKEDRSFVLQGIAVEGTTIIGFYSRGRLLRASSRFGVEEALVFWAVGP